MAGTNASDSIFGWDFQINAAIVLMLEDIENVQKVRVEGRTEDIEITLTDGEFVFSQAKALSDPSSTKNVRKKLADGLGTLNQAAKQSGVCKLIYITNAYDPLADKKSMPSFYGQSRKPYASLTDSAKKVIDNILTKENYNDIDKSKLFVYTLPFENDLNDRYKVVIEKVNDFIASIKSNLSGSAQDVLDIWQQQLFENATLHDTAIVLTKKDMLTISVLMACLSLFLSKPGVETLRSIDWHTLAILFMMLTVLEGFKKENIFQPVLRFSEKITSMVGISFFLIFGVFFSSMFVTNDVSLIVFVPLTILLFRTAKKEPYILPVISMENIAAIRGSLLTPFGSPQNLFLFEQSGISAGKFMLHMLPLWLSSAILLGGFIFFLYRKDPHEKISLLGSSGEAWKPERKKHRIIYVGLFALTVATVVSRTPYWLAAAGIVLAVILLFDRAVLRKTDYVLLVTFFCFFVFSSQITANKTISHFLTNAVAGHEYFWGIGLSQIISNVPASIVLYPFTDNLAALLYGVDTAGLCSVIGSLASVINYRLYVRSYPGQGGRFMKVFTLISWAFFLIVVIPGYFLSKYWLI